MGELCRVSLAADHGPTGVAVDFVVFVFPIGAAAFAAVFGDVDHAVFVGLGAVGALHQLGVAGGAAPVALDARAGGAEFHFLEFVVSVEVVGHRVVFGRFESGEACWLKELAGERVAGADCRCWLAWAACGDASLVLMDALNGPLVLVKACGVAI